MGFHSLAGRDATLWFCRMSLLSSHAKWSIVISRIRPKGKDNRRRSLAEQHLRQREAAFLNGLPERPNLSTLYHVVDNMDNSIVVRKIHGRRRLNKWIRRLRRL